MSNIAGVDEVGRGSLVGPVYAAAVILKKSINNGIKTANKPHNIIGYKKDIRLHKTQLHT